MNPITVSYKLKLKGYSLAKVANEIGVSRQVVWEAISKNRQGGKSGQVWKKIGEILSNN